MKKFADVTESDNEVLSERGNDLSKKVSRLPWPEKKRTVFKDKKFDGRVEAELIALRCQSPPEGVQSWTLRLLAENLVELGIGLNEKDIKREGEQKVVKPVSILNNSYLLVASSEENQLSYSQNPDTGTESSLFTYCLLKVFEDFKKKNKKVKFTDIVSEVTPMVVKFAKSLSEKS